MVEPMGNGLRGTTLRYTHEVRSEAEYFADIPEIALPDEMLRVAEHILETREGRLRPGVPRGSLPHRIGVHAAREGGGNAPAVRHRDAPSPQNVISLMDALKRSLAAEQPTVKDRT